MYTPGHIANFMLEHAEEEGRQLSPMKLLKLVYIAYGWSLAVLDEKLFDEPIYAWAHGPVIRSLYDEFKHHKNRPIHGRSLDLDLEEMKVNEPEIPKDDESVNLVLGKVWDIYKHFSATDLRNMTHEPDTPWSTVYNSRERNVEIPDNLIKDHFRKKIRQYLANVE